MYIIILIINDCSTAFRTCYLCYESEDIDNRIKCLLIALEHKIFRHVDFQVLYNLYGIDTVLVLDAAMLNKYSDPVAKYLAMNIAYERGCLDIPVDLLNALRPKCLRPARLSTYIRCMKLKQHWADQNKRQIHSLKIKQGIQNMSDELKTRRSKAVAFKNTYGSKGVFKYERERTLLDGFKIMPWHHFITSRLGDVVIYVWDTRKVEHICKPNDLVDGFKSASKVDNFELLDGYTAAKPEKLLKVSDIFPELKDK